MRQFFRQLVAGFGAATALWLLSASPTFAQAPSPVPSAPAESTSSGLSQAFAHIGSMDVLDNRHKLEPGDRVTFRITEEADQQPISLDVTSAGELEIPYLGLVPAAGLTCREFAYRVKNDLEKDYYHHATVIMGLESSSSLPVGTVYVTGQVATQGPLEIPRNERFTVSKAILRAGGFGDFADKRRVRILRQHGEGTKPERITVDVKRVLEGGRLDTDVVLQPGDFIVVPERWINF